MRASREVKAAIEERLHAPILMNDFAAWAQAWRSIDEGRIFSLLQLAQKGEPVCLVLCGERNARIYATPPRRPSLIRRISQLWGQPDCSTVLETL